MGVREFQGEGNNIVLSGGDGGLVIYTFKLHHHHHHRHHHHHHHYQSSDSCILKTSNLNFQPNYHFTLAGDLSPNILYPIISGFIGWSKFKHKSPSVFNISKERPVQRKVTRQIQPVVDILTQFFLLWIVLLNFFLKSDHSALNLPSPTTDVSHLERFSSRSPTPLSSPSAEQSSVHYKNPPTCPPRSWKRSSACLSKEASWRIAWHRVWFVTHSLKEHRDDLQF